MVRFSANLRDCNRPALIDRMPHWVIGLALLVMVGAIYYLAATE